jgi:hypothetical protein
MATQLAEKSNEVLMGFKRYDLMLVENEQTHSNIHDLLEENKKTNHLEIKNLPYKSKFLVLNVTILPYDLIN